MTTGFLFKLPGTVLLLILIIYGTLFYFQRDLLFQAAVANRISGPLKSPADYHLKGFKAVTITADDGIHLTSWVHSPQTNMPIIVYFHGNASHIATRLDRYRAFADAGYGIFALSYRGYATSEGTPTEQGLYKDARAALAFVREHYPNTKIILYGESLGSGVAAQLASEQPVDGLVLQSAYTSIENRVAEIYSFLPGIHYLVRDRFDSLSKIPAIKCPVLIFHGEQDNVIPISHGKLLAKAVTSRVQFIPVPGAGHMDIPDTLIIDSMQHFFNVNSDKETTHE